MADNVTLNTGVGGAILATDAIGAVPEVHYQIIKLAHGAADSATLVSTASGLPVAQQGSWTVTLNANSGVDVGDVTVNNAAGTASVPVQGAAAHDAAVAGNPVLLAGRGSTATPTAASTDGDAVYVWVDLNGRVQVGDGGGSLTVDNGGTFAVQAAQSGTWNITNVSGTVSLPTGASTAAKQPALGTAGTASADVLTVQGVASMTPLLVNGSGVTQPVSGTVTANAGTGTFTVSGTVTANLAAGANNIGDVDVASIAAGDNNIGNVDIASGPTGASALQVQGTVAHDGVDAQNPVGVGFNARTTNPAAVADGDRVRGIADDVGRQVIVPHQVRDLLVHQPTTITTTTETTVLTAGAAGVFHDVLGVVVANTSATAVRVDFRDATAGTIRFAVYAPAGQTVGFMPTIPVTQATAANNWTAQLSAAVTDCRIFVQAAKNV